MTKDEFEIKETSDDKFEVIPMKPIRRLEKRIGQLEQAGSIPQLQGLITQIVDLVRTNQKLIDSIVIADTELRNELSKLPPKMDELLNQMRSFMDMIEMAGSEEAIGPASEALKPLADEFKKVIEQNQKLIENNQAILDSLDNIGRKLKGGTPVSQILSAYPGMRLKKREV